MASDQKNVNISVDPRQYKCSECENVYKYFKNLKQHFTVKHPSKVFDIKVPATTSKPYKCDKCDSQFSKIYSLNYHKRKVHEEQHSHRTFQCRKCPCKYSKDKYLRSHMRNKHAESNQTNQPEISKNGKCPICDCSMHEGVIFHFSSVHQVNMDIQSLEFDSLEEFTAWKANIEKETVAKYVKKRGSKNMNTYVKHYYICHRTGNYISKSRGHRWLKTQGSNKIGGICPASITVNESKITGKCSVNFITNHIGHENSLGHLFLTREDREYLAAKIASKVPFDAILDEVRDTISDEKLTRLQLLTKKDLHNIETSFNLSSFAVRHQKDAISVEAWVNQMKDNGCVLFYKPQGDILESYRQLKVDDFMLIIMNKAQCEILKKFSHDAICIDGTHGINTYNFELVTLLVIDDLRQGFPCAFLITNRTDQDVLSIFFLAIKENSGIISPKIFMSDMADCFYNAWCSTMSVPSIRLYCTWHVDRAWRNNLKKVKGQEKQLEVYHILRTLLQETDKDAFNIMVNEAIDNWKSSDDTADFASYFAEYYSKCATSWAYCHRLNSGLNTNMHIERMHGVLKYIYLHGKNVKRLDKAIYAIMRFLRDKLIDRIIVIHKGKISSKVKDLRKRHKASISIKDVNIIKDGDKWSIASASTNDIYSIEEVKKDCTCKLICQSCQACIHRYMCTCIDCSIKWNMCKHIHLLCRFRKENDEIEPEDNTIEQESVLHIVEDSNITETQAVLETLSQNIEKTSTLDKEKAQLKSSIMNLLDLSDSLTTMEEVRILKKIVASAKPTIMASRSSNLNKLHHTVANSGPANKNILPQRRLYATKRKRTITKQLTKPTAEETAKISANLIVKNTAQYDKVDTASI